MCKHIWYSDVGSRVFLNEAYIYSLRLTVDFNNYLPLKTTTKVIAEFQPHATFASCFNVNTRQKICKFLLWL